MADENKKTTRELAFLKSAASLKTPEQRKAFVDDVTSRLLAEVQAERKRQGLPPLE
jgi:uncharacterized protein YkwD